MVIRCNVCGQPVCLLDELEVGRPQAGIARRMLSAVGLDFDPAVFKALLEPETVKTMLNVRCVSHG